MADDGSEGELVFGGRLARMRCGARPTDRDRSMRFCPVMAISVQLRRGRDCTARGALYYSAINGQGSPNMHVRKRV